MEEKQLDSKRIAKNTILLYFRMILLMLISLYTSRVVLKALGVDDYGIYNVVGGVVSMFSIISQSLSVAESRFITFALGKGDKERLRNIFSSALVIQVVMAVVIVVLAEFIAVWFLNNKMNIPPDRLAAARWMLQTSIILFALSLVNVPFSACVVAHEKMNFYAVISILEGVLKLAAVMLLFVFDMDKLKLFAVFLLIVDVLIKGSYVLYCYLKFSECRFRFCMDKGLLKELGSFAGWNLIGNGAWILSTTGVNVLTNMFFPVKVNAARGIASQVDSAINKFVANFTMAINPQITKSFAMGEKSYMHTLVIRGAKYSAYIFMFFAIPICLETETILNLWLHEVPQYTVNFVRLTVLGTLFIVTAESLVKSMFAAGKIKKYQIIVGTIALMGFVITYLCYKLGCAPESAYVVFATVYFVLIFVRLYLVKDMIELKASRYLKEVLLRILIVLCLASILPLGVIFVMKESLLRLLVTLIISSLSMLMTVYFIGMEKSEKEFFVGKLKTLLRWKR